MLNALVNEFDTRVSGVAHAVIVSSDGMLLAATESLPKDRAEQLAAMTAGVVAVTIGAARLLDGDEVKQAMVEMARGYFVVTTIPDGTFLAVLASPNSEIQVVGYELARLAKDVAAHVVPAGRRA